LNCLLLLVGISTGNVWVLYSTFHPISLSFLFHCFCFSLPCFICLWARLIDLLAANLADTSQCPLLSQDLCLNLSLSLDQGGWQSKKKGSVKISTCITKVPKGMSGVSTPFDSPSGAPEHPDSRVHYLPSHQGISKPCARVSR
jgi:hypothetical protein